MHERQVSGGTQTHGSLPIPVDNVPPEVLGALEDQLGTSESPVDALRRVYGARPKAEFIAEQWSVLLESWLPRAADSLEVIMGELRARNVGQADMKAETVEEQIEYLRTCRNTSGLRQVVLAEIRSGESDFRPMPTMKAAPDNAPSVRVDVESEAPSGPGSLTQSFEETLKAILEVSELARDDDGDIPIRQGSAMCYVRVEKGMTSRRWSSSSAPLSSAWDAWSFSSH